MKQVVLFVSSNEQNKDHQERIINNQIEVLQGYCKRNELDVIDIIICKQKPYLQSLEDAIMRLGKTTYTILITEPSRISGQFLDIINFNIHFRKIQITIQSVFQFNEIEISNALCGFSKIQ